jgi:hypothetical protein
LLTTGIDQTVITIVSISVILVSILFQKMSECKILIVDFLSIEIEIGRIKMYLFYSVNSTLRGHMIFTLLSMKIIGIFGKNFIWFCGGLFVCLTWD